MGLDNEQTLTLLDRVEGLLLGDFHLGVGPPRHLDDHWTLAVFSRLFDPPSPLLLQIHNAI